MADIINLRQIRKKAERQREENRAAENRVLHGLSKAEKALGTARNKKARYDIEMHRIKGGDGE